MDNPNNQTTGSATHLLDEVLKAEGQEMPSHEPNGGTGVTATASTGIKQQIIEQQVIETLTTIYDPEIPVDIYELGLIYALEVDPDGVVDVKMTLTSPACPVAGSLPGEVENKIRTVPGVTDVKLELVWDPPYHPDMMSEAARLQLGLL
jgi:FeS assembly SUF system protein